MASLNIPVFQDTPWTPLFDEDDEDSTPLLENADDSSTWKPKPEGEKEGACRVMIRTMQKARAPVDFLRKDRVTLAELPADKFERAVTPALEALKKQIPPKGVAEDPLREGERLDAVVGLRHARSAYQTSHMVPVFTPKGPGIPPACEMRTEDAFFSAPQYQGIRLTSTASVNNNPSYIPSKQELDALVQHLASRKDIFPWDHKQTGCDARACIMDQFLTLMEVPKENHAKVYLSGPEQKLDWKYHVAVIVKASDGVSYVLDPSLDTKKALTVKEWCDLQSPKHIKVENLGRKCEGFTHDPKKAALFTLDSDKMLLTADTETGEITVETEEDSDRAGDYVALAEFRSKLDREFLNKALAPSE